MCQFPSIDGILNEFADISLQLEPAQEPEVSYLLRLVEGRHINSLLRAFDLIEHQHTVVHRALRHPAQLHSLVVFHLLVLHGFLLLQSNLSLMLFAYNGQHPSILIICISLNLLLFLCFCRFSLHTLYQQ